MWPSKHYINNFGYLKKKKKKKKTCLAIKTLSSVKLMAIEFRFILIMMEAIVFIIVVYSFRE
jgi:hypothetical protein